MIPIRVLDPFHPRPSRPNPNTVRSADPRIINIFRRARAIPWTDKDLAAHAGVSYTQVGKLRRGERKLSHRLYRALSNALTIKESK